MKNNYDVIIVGTGASGLYAALNLDSSYSVLCLAKKDTTLSNSSLAQGGVAAVLDKKHDNYKLHIADTLIAGSYKNYMPSLEILVEEGPDDVQNLVKLGVDFDENKNGGLDMTLEGGHSRRRIVHHKDSTGNEIVIKLLAQVKQLPNVDMIDDALLFDIQKQENGSFKTSVLIDNKAVQFASQKVILATGGIGRVYPYTTNSSIATGDGIAIASMMGAKIKNLSFIQFHPTVFAGNDCREQFLISEAVRGEGAVLLNCNGEPFMKRYDERGDLAPRDVVSRCIIEESKKTNSDKFYLDISFKGEEFVKYHFPMIYSRCLEQGVDMSKEWIPVFPSQHYLMGGINTTVDAESNISGLFAVGECSHTGVHGANRLASNSLLEALVFSRRAASLIMQQIEKDGRVELAPCNDEIDLTGEKLPTGIRTEIRQIMQRCHFVGTDPALAQGGYDRAVEIKNQLLNTKYAINSDYIEARSLAIVATIVLKEDIDWYSSNK